jgi:hypothetical protein
MSDETTILEELADQALEPEGSRRSGPGFILGIVFGALAGAVAATLFAPPGPEEEAAPETEAPEPQVEHELGPFGATHVEAPPAHLTAAGEAAPAEAAPSLESEDPLERVRAMLARVRSRVDEARAEGRLARQETEADLEARYEQLTSGQEIRS